MSNLTIRFNGEEIKEVTGVSYLEGVSKLRVVSKLGDRLVSDDYDAESIVIDITGDKIDYRVPVGCVYKASDDQFIGVVGRYNCISISDDGIARIVEFPSLHWIDLKISKDGVSFISELGEYKFPLSTSIGSPIKVLKKSRNEFYKIK